MNETRGIKFDSKHSGTDWGLLLTACNKGAPEPKTNYVSVEGRDGDLDLTEALTGEVRYNNRTDEYGFNFLDGPRDERQALMDEIYAFLHGQKRQIILPDWPDYYSVGRLTVTEFHNYLGYGEMTVEANCEPWLYKTVETEKSLTVSGTDQQLVCENKGVKTVIPTITVAEGGSVEITLDDYTTTLSTGTYKLLEVAFPSGSHTLTIGGTGTVTFKWREAIL